MFTREKYIQNRARAILRQSGKKPNRIGEWMFFGVLSRRYMLVRAMRYVPEVAWENFTLTKWLVPAAVFAGLSDIIGSIAPVIMGSALNIGAAIQAGAVSLLAAYLFQIRREARAVIRASGFQKPPVKVKRPI